MKNRRENGGKRGKDEPLRGRGQALEAKADQNFILPGIREVLLRCFKKRNRGAEWQACGGRS